MKRFWDKVDKSGECWTWTATTLGGYGLFSVSRRMRRAHRVSYEMANGPIPAGLIVRHSCDNKGCVRPDHLVLGTQADNMRDAVERGQVKFVNAEKTHCLNGHPFNEKNTYRTKQGHRQCRACSAQRMKDLRASRKN